MPVNNVEIEYLDESEFPLWDEFIKSSPQGTFFNTSVWLKILESVYYRQLKILVYKKNQEIVCGINYFENKKLFWRLITPVFLLPFNGPLFNFISDQKPQKSISDKLDFVQHLLKKLKSDYNFIQLNVHQTIGDLRAFTWNDFKTEPEHTYLCKLKNENELIAGFNQSLRKKIQKGKQQNFQISESSDAEKFIELYQSSYNRHGLNPPISKATIKPLIKKILSLPNVRLFFLKKTEKNLAGRIVVEDGKTIYDLLAGSIDETGITSSFLVAEIMKKYAGKFAQFDFMGADHAEIEKFKRAFGGELINRFKVQNKPGFVLNALIKIRQSDELKRRKI
jgi:hypothetical protein